MKNTPCIMFRTLFEVSRTLVQTRRFVGLSFLRPKAGARKQA
jgi:hypothetical protein